MKQILLSVSVLFAMSVNAQDCSELFISEYIEGIGNNNAIEIYNPTNTTIDLSAYLINQYKGSDNGALSDSWPLSGSIAAGEAIAVGNGQTDSVWVSTYWSLPVDPVFYAACGIHGSGIYPTPFYFNGDDALTLEKSNGTVVDIFGKVGEDPGLAWTDDASAGYTDANGGTWWTKRQTLVRKASVKQGLSVNPILFNPTLEYDSLPDATYSGMGSHTCDCSNTTSLNENESISYVMYPNPVVKGGVVSINSNSKIQRIRVTNILGGKVMSLNPKSISTSDLSKGTYLISIEFTDGRLKENKLVIK
ncbi:MAG: T9SS type A sorting domain-containing protein [Flavobacteriales bacterium]|jgi:hypothetical protein|nr:T9SS type A sorting domain-containing protein [Flavobacteriales bacterium]